MLTRRKIAVGTSACVVLSWLVCLSVASGIEMRSSRGSRTVVRAASAPHSAPEVKTSRGQQPVADEVVLEEEPMLVETDACEPGCGACEPACGRAACCPDPCGCPPCNLFGGGFWVDLDFLLWWRDRREFPALVTTQPAAGVVPGATVLFGGPVDEQARPGGRLELGVWLDPCQRTAIGGRYLAVADATISPEWTSSSDLPFIARPFTNVGVDPAVPDAYPIANDFPDPDTTGRIRVKTGSETQSSDVFFYWVLRRSPCASFGFLSGYQYSRISENLLIDSFTDTHGGGGTYAITDWFDANNEFHGGHFGLRGEYRFGRFGVELLARFGFGNMRQSITIDGSTTKTAVAGNPVVVAGSGLLAQPSNGGLHVQDEFSYMDEAGIKLAFYPVERLKLSVGYSLMHWSSVVRPGSEIDTLVDERWFNEDPPANATRPAFVFDTTDYIVQGLNFGAEFRF